VRPYRKQVPHRPGITPALGLRAGSDGLLIVPQTASERETSIMLLTHWLGFQRGSSRWTPRGRHPVHRRATPRRRLLPTLERLEDLTLLTNYTAATVSDLIADINTANRQGGTNTITLTAPTNSPYVLTAADNSTDGATGLPVIAANDNLTIVGSGDTIARSIYGLDFRLLDVAAGASLTLQKLTLQGGYASVVGYNVSSQFGGAIYNHGTLDVNAVTVQQCSAGNGAAIYNQGTAVLNSVTVQENAGAGVICNAGTLNLENATVQSNNGEGIFNLSQATADLNNVTVQGNYAGIDVLGGSLTLEGGSKIQNNYLFGGLHVLAGTVSVTNTTFSSNVANSSSGEANFGGGMRVDGGTVSVTNTTFSANMAVGVAGYRHWVLRLQRWVTVPPIHGMGGALYVGGGTVTVTGTTFSSNTAKGASGSLPANGLGGAVCVVGGSVALHNDTMTGNAALSAGAGSYGYGGGLYINGGPVCLDAFTQANVVNNTASTRGANIYGPYTICP
jgi:hypothetical protein